MQKAKVLCLIVAMVMASVGTVVVAQNFGDGPDTTIVLPNDDQNTVLDKPAEGDPSQYDLKQNLYIAAGELKRSGGFVGVSHGTTTSVGMAQEVSNKRTVVNGNVFKEMATVGVVKNAYQLYLYGNNYLYRKPAKITSTSVIKWADTAQKFTEDAFLDKFGHRSDALTGYILNDETIVDARIESTENGLYSYRYILDINTAPARMLREMKANSGMSNYSTFEKAEIVVTMDADWQVKSLRTDCKYKVPMLGGLDCVEDITETFSGIGTQGDLPEKEFFEQFFDASIDTPIDEEPDALSVLMEIFQPYLTGEKLNASLNVELDETKIVSALVSANIDINNFDNITADIKVGTDLYLSYNVGKLFVTYQDFKGSTTLDGIMGLVQTLLPKQDDGADDSGESEIGDDILSKFTYSINDGHCVVNMPITLGDINLEANIYADIVDGKYVFTGADAKLGELRIDVKPAEQWEVPEIKGEYPEILGLLDLVKNGVVAVNANVNGLSVDAMIELSSKSLYAKAGDLSVIMRDNVAHLTYGEVKLKLALSDINELADLIGLFVDGGINLEMPSISVDTVLAMLSNIKAVNTNGVTAFVIEIGDISASIELQAASNGWNVSGINVSYNGLDLQVTPEDKFVDVIPVVDGTQYADITDIVNTFAEPISKLIKGGSYGVDFAAALNFNGKGYLLDGYFTYDNVGNIQVNATIGNNEATYINADVVFADGNLYIDLNGIKLAFELPKNNAQIDFAGIVEQLSGIDENVDKFIDVVEGIIGAVAEFDIAQFDFVNLVKSFAYDKESGSIDIIINAQDFALGEFGIGVAVVDGKITATLSNLTVANVCLDIMASVESGVDCVVVPNASDYITELKIDVNGIFAYVQLDMLNKTVRAYADIFGEKLVATYVDNKVYVKYGNIKAYIDVTEIDKLVALISNFVDLDGGIDIDVKGLLDGIFLTDTENGFKVGISLGNIYAQAEFDRVDGMVTFAKANVEVDGVSVNVSLVHGLSYPEITVDDSFINVTDLAEAFVEEIANLIRAQGYEFIVSGNIAFGEKCYGIVANVNYNGGLYVNATLSLDNVQMLNAEVYLVDGVLYADIGGIRLALDISSGAASINQSLTQTLEQYFGYNEYVDILLNLIINIVDNANLNDIPKLIKSLSFDGSALKLTVNGGIYGLSEFDITLVNNDGLNASIDGLAYKDISLNLNANVNVSESAVTAPSGDYSTNLLIEIDEKNTVYANINLIDGIFRFRIGELYITYFDNTVKINYDNQLFVTGNIAYIIEKVKKIDEIVNEFSGADKADLSDTLSLFDGIDLKAILQSLTIFAEAESNFGQIGITVLNMPVKLNLRNGNVEKLSVQINDDSTVNIKPDVLQYYYEFTGNENYVVIEDVFEDYFETFKKLVYTNSWRFDFTKQSEIAVGQDKYAISSGSYVEFYYKNTAQDEFKLRANLTLLKVNAATNQWEQFITLDAVYIDGEIYVTYNGKLKATIRKDTLVECYNEVLPELQRVVPQIKTLMDKIIAAMTEVKDIDRTIDFSTVLRNISYENGVFSLTVNGSVFMGSLGDISIMVSQTENGLSLDALSLVYDNISVNIEGMTVSASDIVETDNVAQYAVVNDILAYDKSSHIDLNSLKQLLLAFVNTADMKTVDQVTGKDLRAFDLKGNLHVNLGNVDIGVHAKVDIDENEKSFVAVKLEREKTGSLDIVANAAFDDRGGDSYLYFNGDTERISVIRNSYIKKTIYYTETETYYHCTKHDIDCNLVAGNKYCWRCVSGKNVIGPLEREVEKSKNGVYIDERNYAAENLTTQEFANGAFDYILEMVNFSNMIEGQIRDAMNGEKKSDFGIEDIIKWYEYNAETQAFVLKLDLSAIDSMLGELNLNIYHDGDYNLTKLGGNIKLVSILDVTLDLNLQTPTYGVATNYVEQTEFWQG